MTEVTQMDVIYTARMETYILILIRLEEEILIHTKSANLQVKDKYISLLLNVNIIFSLILV